MRRHDVRGCLRAIAVALTLGMLAPVVPAADDPAAARAAAVHGREEYVYSIALQAYVYGYPLVEMYRVRDQTVFNPANPRRTPLNRFLHLRELMSAKSRVVVAPNNDTLYSSAWLDLSHGPVVLDVPDTAGRYYVMQFMDFYTNNVAYVGKRTTGTAAGSYAIVGPGWSGTLPRGLKELRSPTNAVWLLGRTLVDGPDDLAAVHALQDRYVLTSLAAWHQPNGADAVTPLPDLPRYTTEDPLAFFRILDAALTENPPPAREASLMALFGQIGIGPGKVFDATTLDEPTVRGLKRAADEGAKLVASLPANLPAADGWQALASHTGSFGDDYVYRAFIARNALAANDPEEAYNFIGRQDAQGRPLNGSHRYVLRFAAGQLPPVHAFWSVTMYDLARGFFIANPIDRYALGDRSKSLKRGADGSVEIYIQRDSPGPDKEGNWLPAPDGDFELGLRCYLADPAIPSGRWKPPGIVMVD